jgi:hypothetical protein
VGKKTTAEVTVCPNSRVVVLSPQRVTCQMVMLKKLYAAPPKKRLLDQISVKTCGSLNRRARYVR